MGRIDTVDVRRAIAQCAACGRRFSGDAAFCPFDGSKLVGGVFDPLSDPLIGATVDGRYEVLEMIGEGGMGRVYKVRHTALDRAFAMKVLRSELARDLHLAERFTHEARATASIKHRNVVQITDFGNLPGSVPYFVMELLEGRTLARVLRDATISTGKAVGILREVALGLAAAHAEGVIHRDVKPDNIFVLDSPSQAGLADVSPQFTERPQVRVVDFGAAKIVGASRITRAGIVFGTPHYMSPEQAAGRPVDHRADVYALGVVLYEIVTGQVPFQGDTYAGVLSQHMFVQPVPPSQRCRSSLALGALERITLACLAKDPSDRFASMGRLAEALDAEARRLNGESDLSDAEEGERRSPSKWTWAAAGAACAIAGVLAIVAARASSSRDSSASAPSVFATSGGGEMAAESRFDASQLLDPPPSTATSTVPPVNVLATAAPDAGARALRPPRNGTIPRNRRVLDDIGDPFAHGP